MDLGEGKVWEVEGKGVGGMGVYVTRVYGDAWIGCVDG